MIKISELILVKLEKIQYFIVVFFMGMMVVVAFLQVIGRHTPFPFSSYFEEILRYSFVWASMLGGVVALKNKNHIGLNILSEILSEKIQKYLKVWCNFASFLVSVFLSFISFKLILKLYKVSMISTSLEIPMWIISLAIPFGFMLMSIYCLIDVFKSVRTLSKQF